MRREKTKTLSIPLLSLPLDTFSIIYCKYVNTVLPPNSRPPNSLSSQIHGFIPISIKLLIRGVGTGEAGEASASPDFRG